VTPLEIIVVDQTAKERRDSTLAGEFDDLPLKVMYLDQAGQCSSRNAGLCAAKGDYVLFIDDDDEVPPTLIEKHLENLRRFDADASCGVADEVGAGPLPETFTRIRTSDVFPTNNSLVRKDVLRRSGLFDLAYERGQRADGDLGMRLYLSGALMVLNPEISVLHHHAPSGGLRAHKARVVTYASSRGRLTHRHLLSPTEIYLAMRYFSARQLREELWLRTLGTFIIRGSKLKQALKFFVSLVYLPDTLWKTRERYRQADSMRQRFPQIPWLADREDVAQDTPLPGVNRVELVHH
jgi:glycosyltransferase involved in cell wall biosynthesis